MHELTVPLYRICRRAGKVLCDLYADHLRRPLQVDRKADDTPVTRADVQANEIITAGLSALCPGMPVLSEEASLQPYEERRAWNQYWLLDPLDGTREFIEGTGHFCVSIAMLEGNQPVLGAIYLPLAGWLYVGGMGCEPFRYSESGAQTLRAGPINSQSPIKMLCSRRGDRDPRIVGLRRQLSGQFPWVMTELRGSAWKFCRICEGAGHLYPRFGATSEWDTAAGQAILEAAGGQVVDFAGKPLLYNRRPALQNPPFLALGPAHLDLMESLSLSS